MDYLDEVGDENKFKSYMSYTGIMIMLVPTLIFFGPGLIYHSIKKHMEKKESALNREMEMTIERIRCNNREMERLQRYTRRNRVEDFKPKKYLVPHAFIEKPFIIDYFASGYNNTYTQQPNHIRYE